MLQAVYNKYLSKKFLKVAARAELTGPKINQLTEASWVDMTKELSADEGSLFDFEVIW